MKTFRAWLGAVCCVLFVAGTYTGWQWRAGAASPQPERGGMDTIAEAYVKLVLADGQHDADYVDAYYGPPAWKTAAETTKASLDAIASRAEDLMAELGRVPAPSDEMRQLRERRATTG